MKESLEKLEKDVAACPDFKFMADSLANIENSFSQAIDSIIKAPEEGRKFSGAYKDDSGTFTPRHISLLLDMRASISIISAAFSSIRDELGDLKISLKASNNRRGRVWRG